MKRSIGYIVFLKACICCTLHAQALPMIEYAAGDSSLPFAFSTNLSSASRPDGLNFKDQQGAPDNCQVFVRIEGELWEFKMRFTQIPLAYPARYKGQDIDHLVRQEDAGMPPGYLGWFLGGMWYDEVGKKLYAPMHVEALGINRDGPIAPWPSRKIILATSLDKGITWQDEGDIVTPETYFSIHDAYKFSGSELSNGLCDFAFYTDTRGGYFYIYPAEGWFTKGTLNSHWTTRVARCAISDKMASGKWTFFYKGKWDQPALGGKSSVIPAGGCLIYNTYLKKYLCLFQSGGSVDDPTQNCLFNIGDCSDLSKQDWNWTSFRADRFGAINLLNAEGSDIQSCGRDLRLYWYSNENLFQRYDLRFSEGATTGTKVSQRYSFEPHPESSDSLHGRQTKFIGTESKTVEYSGSWVKRTDPQAYDGQLKECNGPGSVGLSFKGSDIYWRAVRSPSGGRVDVFIDGKFRKTVDCYLPTNTDNQEFAYALSGLAPDVVHNIKIVTRSDSHAGEKNSTIRHIGFEYSAESYKASAGFSSISGKNNWSYEEWLGGDHSEMRFCESQQVLSNYWFGNENQIGPGFQAVNVGAAIRKWTAPHDGLVEVEGSANVTTTTDGVSAAILRNQSEIWPTRPLISAVPAAHDIMTDVRQGDDICFVVIKKNPKGRTDVSGDKVTWDPVVTYTKSVPPEWRPNLPSHKNLALGKYVRSKRLMHAYRPYNAVDGSDKTFFALSDADEVSSGKDDWLMVDLDRSYLVDHYVVVTAPKDGSMRITSFVLQKSDDGFSWTNVDSVENNTSTRVERTIPPFKGRWVRLYLPDGRPFCINEFELYFLAGR